MLKSRFRSEEGGAGTFFVVLLLFLLVVGGAAYFFTQHPHGKKMAADLIKKYAQYTGTTTENPPGTIAPAPGVPEAPAPPNPEDLRRQTQADVYVKEAGDALTKGNIDVAGDMVEKALALVPNHSAALKLQVEVVRKKGERRVEEERQKRLASETAPKPVPVVPAPPVVEKPSANDLLIRAKAFLAAEDLVKAEEYARKAVDADPANAEAVQVLKSVLAAKKPVPAVPVNDNAANAEKAAALVKQSRSLLVQGHYDAAREVAVRALSITPEDASITALITEIEEARKAAEPPKSAPVVAVPSTPQPVVAPVITPPTPQPAPVVVQPATQPVPVQPAGQDSAEKARALLASAHILADTGSVEAARATGLRALELDPSNRDIIAFLGTLEAKPKPVETAVVSGTAKSTAPDTATPVFVQTPAAQPVQPQPATPAPEKVPVVQQPPVAPVTQPVAPVVQPVTTMPPAVQPTPVASPVPPVAQPTPAVAPVQPVVQPAPMPAPPATVTALPMTKDNARQILAKLDDALRKGDVDAYTALLGTDLVGPEKANVKEFFKEATDIRLTRDPAISLVPAENSATLVSDYTIEYRIQNVPVKVSLQCKYGLVRTPEGGWIIDWVSSQRK